MCPSPRREFHDDRSRPFSRGALPRSVGTDEDDDHGTHTHRPAPDCPARREGELATVRGGKERLVPGKKSGVLRLRPRGGKKKGGRPKKERRRGGPLHRGEVTSRQQALPRREWVAPRRPRINKTTARPSPVLGPAWSLPAVCLRDARTPDVPTAAHASPPSRSPRAHQSPDAARSSAGSARKPARVRNSRRGIDIRRRRRRPGVSTGKSAKSAPDSAGLGDFAGKFGDDFSFGEGSAVISFSFFFLIFNEGEKERAISILILQLYFFMLE